jgi:Family of unknown function (DUF6356)
LKHDRATKAVILKHFGLTNTPRQILVLEEMIMNVHNEVVIRQNSYGSDNEWKFSNQENASRKRSDPVILRLFTEHPASVGESYQEHLKFAFGFGGRMLIAGTACCIHGILPFLFGSTGSRAIRNLHGVLLAKRSGSTVRSDCGLKTDYEI